MGRGILADGFRRHMVHCDLRSWLAYQGVAFMNGRKIIYIDVSKMTEQELCETLDIEYVPWYRSSLFWALALCFSLPSIMMIMEVVR